MSLPRRRRRQILAAVTVAYFALAAWLLGRRGYAPHSSILYWDYVRRNIQLIPLRTIGEMFRLCTDSSAYSNVRVLSAANLAGNALLFFPAGILLPSLFCRLRRWGSYLGLMLGLILAVEVVQLFTLRGSLDVDDVLLNGFGAVLGFWLWRRLAPKPASSRT